MLFDYKPANNHPNDTWIHVFSQALSFRQTAIIQTGQLLSLPLNVRTLLWEYAQYGDCLRESPVSNAWPWCKMIYAECVDIYSIGRKYRRMSSSSLQEVSGLQPGSFKTGVCHPVVLWRDESCDERVGIAGIEETRA